MSDSPLTRGLSPEKQALLALRRARARLEEIERQRTEPIAVIGVGCRFPGAATGPDAYWQVLRDGIETVTEVPRERWDVDAYYDPDPDAIGKTTTRRGGFLQQVDQFDPQFFGIAPREAVQMDPQHRLLLEVSWEALEHAGQAADRLAGTRTGVFIGITGNDYVQLLLQADPADVDAYCVTGNSPNFAAGRLSYLLGLQGPSLTLDTACSSSLVAVHLACQSLRSGESRMALAGGVNVILAPEHTVLLSKARMLAPDGRCKTFDAAADGYVRGEGCGVVVLKRLSDAVADGDRVLAVICGTAVNQDGRSSGLTVPNGPAQEALIREALASGRVQPHEVAYVEAHGSGTSLGDPIEVRALNAVLGEGRSPERPLAIGSAKTNLGHLEAAAGIAGLIKVILSLERGEIPRHLHFETPNPHIPWAQIPIVVASSRAPWPAGRRLAGVSSFGASGTNAHVVLEEAPPAAERAMPAERPLHLLALSAKSGPALRALAAAWGRRLRDGGVDAADAAFTANAGRAHFAHRLGVIGASAGDFAQGLEAFASGHEPANLASRAIPAAPPKIAFLFTGQGSQFAGMGRELYDTQPAFRRAMDRCDELTASALPQRLTSAIYPEGGAPSPLDETAFAQPALFALQYALCELLASWGIRPSAVLGHSVGAFAAAAAAGVLRLEDATTLIAARAQLMQALPRGGAMAAVLTDEATVRAAVAAHAASVSVAALNAPDNTVISGTAEGVEAVLRELASQGVRAERLTVSHAFHSALMDPMLERFAQAAAGIAYRDPHIVMASDLTGALLQPGEVSAAYWRDHARQPVRFAAALESLYARGCRVFVEIGPRPVLSGMGRRFIADDAAWLPVLRKGKPDWQQVLETIRDLYTMGADIDWAGFDREYPRRKVQMPTYPFERQRCWIASPSKSAGRPAGDAAAASWTEWLYEPQWEPAAPAADPEADASDPGAAWVLLADDGGVASALAGRLRASGERCVLVAKGERFEAREDVLTIDPLDPSQYSQLVDALLGPDRKGCRAFVHCWGLDESCDGRSGPAELDLAARRACGSVLYLAQALGSPAVQSPPSLAIVTRGAQRVREERDAPVLAQSLAWGLGRVIAAEHPELRCAQVDLDPEDRDLDGSLDLLHRAVTEAADEDQVAIRTGERYVLRLAPHAVAPDAGLLACSPEGTYLITGGLSGLGLQVAERLAERGAKRIALMGRRAPSEAAFRTIRMLEARGVGVLVVSADVADRDALANVIEQFERAGAPLRGIVHSAGTVDDGVLARQSWERFQAVMAAKVHGAWNLHALTESRPLDFFVLFSSSASLLGPVAQGNYAAANAFLDGLAHYRRARGLTALSVNWGPWSEVGLAARGGVAERVQLHGLGTIDPARGLSVLEYAIRAGRAQLAVLPANWADVLGGRDGRTLPLFRELTSRAALAPRDAAGPSLRDEFAATPPHRRWPLVLAHVTEHARRVLGVPAEAPVDPEQGLRDLGLDSLMAVELRNRLQRAVGRPLRSTLAFDCPTIEAIARHLVDEALAQAGAASPAEPADREGDDLLAAIEQLSDDQAERLLARKTIGSGV